MTFCTVDAWSLISRWSCCSDCNACCMLTSLYSYWLSVISVYSAVATECHMSDGRPCPGSIPGAGHLFRYVTNQPPKANSAFHPSGIGKWVPASAGKAKAGMVHSVSVQVKLWDPLRTRAIPERLRGVFTTRRYTNPRLPLSQQHSIKHSDSADLRQGVPGRIPVAGFGIRGGFRHVQHVRPNRGPHNKGGGAQNHIFSIFCNIVTSQKYWNYD